MRDKEIGLKGIYRIMGVAIAKILIRISKPFNPNIITISGFIISMASMIAFGLYGKKATYNIYMLVFILGTQLALILDYADGSYARIIGRTSHWGDILDGFLDSLKIIFLFGLSYLVSQNRIKEFLIVGLILIYVLDQRVKLILVSQNRQNPNVLNNQAVDNTKAKWSYAICYMIRIPFGFNVAHCFLYMSLWFLFDFTYFLFVLYITGLFSVYSRLKPLLRQHVKKALL
jgi:phosphatidylglycerophosphate synthase